MMRYRRLGRTGLAISEITIGTGGLAGGAVDADAARAAIGLALDGGVNAIEMAAGNADAAGIVASALERRDSARDVHVLARPTSLLPFDLPSPHVHAQQAYPGRHIRAETEALLQTLGIERLAVQQIHAWCPEWLNEGDWLETLGRLRDEGKIAGIGISLWDHDVDAALEAVSSGAVDCVQLLYNIFDPGAAARLFPLCRRQDVGVVARSPLYYGALTARIEEEVPFAAGEWRRAYFFDDHLNETRLRAQRLARELQDGGPVAETALRFSLSHPAVSTIVVGMLSPSHVESNVKAIEKGPLDAAALQRLALHKWLC